MEQLRNQLTGMIELAQWSWLMPHAKRDAVVLVNPDLDLVEVGLAISTDNVLAVQRWIQEAMLVKPTSEQLSDWNRDTSKQFKTLIVQPYVLVQEPMDVS